MSNKEQKVRVIYSIRKDWEGNWYLNTDKCVPMGSAEEAISAAKALYMMEDHENIKITVNVDEIEAVDQLFGLE